MNSSSELELAQAEARQRQAEANLLAAEETVRVEVARALLDLRYAGELYEDKRMRRIGKRFPTLVVLSLAIPTVAGFVLHGFTLGGALRGYVWGGLVRIFFVHHVTWSVNSICHFFGRRRFDIEDHSTNVAWLAVFSLGESWHHNHHAFPRSAYHGLRWWELDLSGLFISGLEKVGLAWNVVRIPPERQLQKTGARAAAH